MRNDLLERILVAVYTAMQKRNHIPLRYLASLIYVAERILDEKRTTVYDVLCDGVESEAINMATEILMSKKYIVKRKTGVNLSDKGIKYVTDILSQPDRRDMRLFYRVLMELVALDMADLLRLAEAFFAVENGIQTNLSDDIKQMREKLLTSLGIHKDTKYTMKRRIN